MPVDKGWPTPSDADAEAKTTHESQQFGKYKEYVIHALTRAGFEQKAYPALIGDPNEI